MAALQVQHDQTNATKPQAWGEWVMKEYLISAFGYEDESFIAETASKARYMCFKAMVEAGILKRSDFRRFLQSAYTLHLGEFDGDPRTPKYGVAP